MQRAQELLAGRNLTRHNEGRGGTREMVKLTLVPESQRLERPVQHILSLLANHYLVRAVFTQSWDPWIRNWRRNICLLGRRENALMAEHVLDFLHHKIQTLWLAKARRQKGHPAGEEAALIPLERVDVDRFVNLCFPKLTSTARASYTVDMDAFAMGTSDGHDIVIHSPIQRGERDEKSERRLLAE